MKNSVLVSSKISEKCAKSLENRGFELIKVPENASFDGPVSAHPDIFAFVIDNNIVCHREIKHLFEKMQGNYKITEARDFGKAEKCLYPDDCGLNFALCGDKLIGKQKCADQKIKEIVEKYNLKIFDVNQGYAKCNICIVDGNSIITEDKGIYKKCTLAGMDVLLLEKYEVNLEGYKNGFIGGASGLYNKTLYFCGNIQAHGEYEKIYNFCSSKGISVVSLSDEPLCDCGSLIFI